MPTRMLRIKDNTYSNDFSSNPTCGTPRLATLMWHSCRTPLVDTIAQRPVRHSCLTLLFDTLVGHWRLTLLWDTLTWHSCKTPLLDTPLGHFFLTFLWDALTWHSCKTLLLDTLAWHFLLDTLVRHSYLTLLKRLLWDTLPWHSCKILSLNILVGHSCLTVLQDPCLTLLWNFFMTFLQRPLTWRSHKTLLLHTLVTDTLLQTPTELAAGEISHADISHWKSFDATDHSRKHFSAIFFSRELPCGPWDLVSQKSRPCNAMVDWVAFGPDADSWPQLDSSLVQDAWHTGKKSCHLPCNLDECIPFF